MRKKTNKKKKVFARVKTLVFMIPLLIVAYLFLINPGAAGNIYEHVFPEREQVVEDKPEPEEVEKVEDSDEKMKDVEDPFEDALDEGEKEKDPDKKSKDEKDKAEDEDEVPEATAEKNDHVGDDNEDLDVIADGDYLLALVTKETTLQSDYVPSDLKPVPSYMNPAYDMQLREEALEHLKDMYEAAEADGVTLGIRSAYRSYDTQHRIFKDYAERHGEKEANRFSARPGQSEHQLGTTVDFGGTKFDFTDEFAYTEQGEWLAENAYLYGFALSYPENKEEITGYIYEPWHYRYIGVDAAKEWKESGLTLKEYLKQQPQEFE